MLDDIPLPEKWEQEQKEPSHNRASFKPRILGFAFLSVLVLFGVWQFVAFEKKYKDRFYPGIFIAGESVGGETYDEVLTEFKEKASKLTENGLAVNFEGKNGEREVSVPMSTSGLTSDNSIEYFTLGDWENNLQEAYKWGRRTDIIRGLEEQATLFFVKKDFNFSSDIYEDATGSLLASELDIFLKKSVPATFSLDGTTAVIVKEEMGESINTKEVTDALEKKLTQFDGTPAVFIAHQDTPQITEKDLSPFLDFAGNMAKKVNVVFQYGGHTWQVKGPKLITWLTVNKAGAIGVDNAKLENYLASTVAKFIDNPPQNSRFEMKDGKLIETVPGKSGFAVNTDDVVEKIQKIITDMNLSPKVGTLYVPIETMEVEPKVTKETVEKYYIKDLVGEMRTSFVGSTADREHNIKIGVATITGMLIAPGAEFSTVNSLGPVTEKEGYVKELVIKEKETTKEYGGGLCQVATTLFRLALNAGMPITERTNHRFVVHYYDPPGLDATIYAPHPDFRFVNDTGNYLLLQARVENQQVIMELYGQKDGRTAKVSTATMYDRIPAPPTKYVPSTEIPVGQTKCTESPHDGVTTDVLYTVNYPDGTVKEKNFHSIYQPWQKVCLVGTASVSSL